MTFHVEKWESDRFHWAYRCWRRVASDLPTLEIALNMKRTLAAKAGIDEDNYCIVGEEVTE